MSYNDWLNKNNIPNYPSDSDYTTNAPSYYENLARKQKLIKMLAKKIWEYEEKLELTLEELETRLQFYIESWNKGLEELPDNVESLLQEWLSDGTLDHIINDTIFNWKVDQTEFDEFVENTTSQLAQIQYLATDLGVKTDGTDTTAELQEAIDYIQSVGGKLKLPKASMVITDTIYIPLENVEGFEIEGFPNNETILRSQVTGKPSVIVYGPTESGSPLATRYNTVKNIRIEPYDNTYEYRIGGFVVQNSISNYFEDIYVRKAYEGIKLKNTFENGIRGFTELNKFVNCTSSWSDFNWVFDGLDNDSSFHGNQFIGCGATAINLELSKGYGRTFNQVGLDFRKGFMYNCRLDFSLFLENGATLMNIGCGGNYNYATITYESFTAQTGSGYPLLPPKITTVETGNSRLKLVGDIFGIGTAFDDLDLSDYHLTDNGSERLVLDSFNRIFQAEGVQNNNIPLQIVPYESRFEESRNIGAKTGFYRYNNRNDYANETGLIGLVRGSRGRFIIAQTFSNEEPEEMQKLYEFDANGRIRYKNDYFIEFSENGLESNEGKLITDSDYVVKTNVLETGNEAKMYETTVYHNLGYIPATGIATLKGTSNGKIVDVRMDEFTENTAKIKVFQTDTNFRSLQIGWVVYK